MEELLKAIDNWMTNHYYGDYKIDYNPKQNNEIITVTLMDSDFKTQNDIRKLMLHTTWAVDCLEWIYREYPYGDNNRKMDLILELTEPYING